MVIIAYSELRNFVEKHADSMKAIDDWCGLMSSADWSNLNELKELFPKIDYVSNDWYVFNIKGKHYRLIGIIHFSIRTIYIRGIFTHADYDKIDVATIQKYLPYILEKNSGSSTNP